MCFYNRNNKEYKKEEGRNKTKQNKRDINKEERRYDQNPGRYKDESRYKQNRDRDRNKDERRYYQDPGEGTSRDTGIPKIKEIKIKNANATDENEFQDVQVTASTTSNVDHGHVNPIANGEFTIFTPLSPPHYNNNVFLANEQIIKRTPEDYVYGDIDVSSWFHGPEKDFPRVKLKYIRELGKGWFGKVVEGAAQDINPDQVWSTVVVRILDAAASSKERLLFLHDAEIYRYGTHPNILGLIGRCLDTVPLLLLQEHCGQGDLKGYLRENKQNAEKLLSTEYPLMWCSQLTSALRHLHYHNVVHPDLATRNCQLTAGLGLKLGDYGLAASKYPQDYYTGSLGVPVRWCSPESLVCTATTIQPRKITLETNIWSLGVTMWEIYECGQQPYQNLSDDEVVSQVFGPLKVRLQRPTHQVLYTDYIFRLMQLCWTNAESRPSVSQIDLMLIDLMQVHKNRNRSEKEMVDDFDKRWESLKPNAIIKTDNCNSDTVSIDIGDEQEQPSFLKPLSASLKNLHGSLDDLERHGFRAPAKSWSEIETIKLDDVACKTNTLENQLASENISNYICENPSNVESKIDFRLGTSMSSPNQKSLDLFNQNDSLTDSIIFVQRTSSESETEDENWKKKVERGAYTEKVRLKSRSVADLMILTHIDCSESESETPLHSLDYKSFRYTPKNNLESLSVTFSSEGNLLNIEDKFQEELKKLQVERRDSLLFVPDNNSPSSVVQTNSDPSLVSPSKRLLRELNSPTEIEPVNQIYNVFNVTIDKYCPLNVNSSKLSEIINLKCNDGTNIDDLSFTRQDSENKSDLGYNTLHNSERNSEFGGSVDENISEFREEFCEKERQSRVEESVIKHYLQYKENQPTDTNKEIAPLKYNKKEEETEAFEKKEVLCEAEESAVKDCFQFKENQDAYELQTDELNKEEIEPVKGTKTGKESHTRNEEIETLESGEVLYNADKSVTGLQSKENKTVGANEVQTNELNMKEIENALESGTRQPMQENLDIDHNLASQTINDLDYVKKLSSKIENVEVADNDIAASVIDEMIEHLKEEREKLIKENEFLESYSLNRDVTSFHNKFKGSRVDEIPLETAEHLPQIRESDENEVGDFKETQNLSFGVLQDDGTKCMQIEAKLSDVTSYPNGKESVTNVIIDFLKHEKIESSLDLETAATRQNCHDLSSNDRIEQFQNVDQGRFLLNTDDVVVVQETDEKVSKDEFKLDERISIEDFSNVPKSENEVIKIESDLPEEQDKINNKGNLHGSKNNLTYKNEDCLIHDINDTADKIPKSLTESPYTLVHSNMKDPEGTLSEGSNIEINKTDDENFKIFTKNTDTSHEVPKLCDLIQNNDKLMDYIIANYDDLETNNDVDINLATDVSKVVVDSAQNKAVSPNVGSGIDNDDITYQTFDQDLTENVTNKNRPESKNIKEEFPAILDHTEIISCDKLRSSLENNSPNENASPTNFQPLVQFDLSNEQGQTTPNSLSHSTVFTSTPFGRKQELSLPPHDTYSSLNLFDVEPDHGEEELLEFSSNFTPLEKSHNNDLKYSLETWDNYLGKTLDFQLPDNNDLFDSFSKEPQSLLFLENDIEVDKKEIGDGTFVVKEKKCDQCDTEVVNVKEDNDTFVIDNKGDSTFTIAADDQKDGTFVIANHETFFDGIKHAEQELEEAAGSWETGGGWFLHPQSNNDHLSGDMQMPSTSRTDSYVGFGMDDEIMAAIRNELLQKLPHAQGSSSDKVREDEEEWESGERNEVFLRYNVYNTPLSPIPEESFIEENDYSSGKNTPKKQPDDTDSDWSEPGEPENLPQDYTTSRTNENSVREPTYRYTASQDSCCSNDTLFNLEDLNGADKDGELKMTNNESSEVTHNFINDCDNTVTHDEESNDETIMNLDTVDVVEGQVKSNIDLTVLEEPNILGINQPVIIKDEIGEFLMSNTDMSCERISKPLDEALSTSIEEGLLVPFTINQVAPLPSPEDNPLKQLPASMLSYDKIVQNCLFPDNKNIEPKSNESQDKNCFISKPLIPVEELSENPRSEKILNTDEQTNPAMDENLAENMNKELKIVYENVNEPRPTYENLEKCADDIYNEADYVNIVNMENTKNTGGFLKDQNDAKVGFIDPYNQHEEFIIKSETDDDDDNDFYGVLTDIRFSGPTDAQMMSTSFSESNDNDEQDWDSGSDTRSTSSGEFIWKEGEHEESLKALRAAPQDVFEDVKPLEGIAEETTSESEANTSSDEDGETPEFVPSAWDKYATPTKSALRSPEKTLERSERVKRKSKGVWFKKQKYHCVYEYPREPESPILHSQDLWKPETDYTAFADWEFDAETYLPPPTDDSDIIFPSTFTFKPKSKSVRNDLYQLTSISDFPQSSNTGADDQFFISSSARPFDISNLTSQFFPGNSNWIDNATPDSGVEDTTPGSVTDAHEYPNVLSPKINSVQSLKKLASDAVNQGKIKTSEVLGGMRHTRNKLKLDLPPSPSAFTSTKTFTMEEPQEPIVIREKPTFSTFGKSRFMVQHVETPPVDETIKNKNVSFEALPYKPPCLDAIREKENDASYKILYEPLERHPDCNEMLEGKNKAEFVRGEASLLDSADEDSGIESSTLERKLSSVKE